MKHVLWFYFWGVQVKDRLVFWEPSSIASPPRLPGSYLSPKLSMFLCATFKSVILSHHHKVIHKTSLGLFLEEVLKLNDGGIKIMVMRPSIKFWSSGVIPRTYRIGWWHRKWCISRIFFIFWLFCLRNCHLCRNVYRFDPDLWPHFTILSWLYWPCSLKTICHIFGIETSTRPGTPILRSPTPPPTQLRLCRAYQVRRDDGS